MSGEILRRVEHRFAKSADGVKIHYAALGQGKPLVLVHGLGESYLTWKPQLQFFPEQGFRVLAVDLRGHGDSEIPSKRITMEDFAGDVESVLRAEGLEKALMIGYSMGGLVLLELYEQSPNLFEKLVLEAVAPEYPPAMTELLENMSMHEIAAQVAEFAVSPTASAELKKDIYAIISKTDKRVYIQSAEAATQRSYYGILTMLQVPTLIISGELDYISPPEVAEEISRIVKGSRKIVFPKVGHMPHRENPEEYNKAVLEFLKGA
ncbi:MAG: alpha/beta hydrolase [Thermofilum sp.]|uniref:Alpha/beta hydrolase n=1 Tax=Thermofilum pendens TaxID=2269 RepID=A0A7C4H683_THEPE